MDLQRCSYLCTKHIPRRRSIFDTAAMSITFILTGKLLDSIAKRRTSEAIRKIMGSKQKSPESSETAKNKKFQLKMSKLEISLW